MGKIKDIFKKAVNIIGYVLVFAMVAALILVLRGNIKGEVTFFAGRAVVWVKTQSMEPEIPEKSYILIKKASAADVKVGDVIVFKSDDPLLGGAYNTHRVIEIVGDNEAFMTKGDNNFLPDQYNARAENVVGIYLKKLPVLSVFGRLLQNQMGIIIAVTIIFALVLIIYVPDMIKANKERTAEIEKKRRDRIDELVREEIEKLRAADSAKGDGAEAESGGGEEDAENDALSEASEEETPKEENDTVASEDDETVKE